MADSDLPCTKCGANIEFTSPEPLCHFHWSEWWCEGVYEEWPKMRPFQRNMAIKETMQNHDTPLTEEDEAEIAAIYRTGV